MGTVLRSINNKNKDRLLLMNLTVANVKSREINERRFYQHTNKTRKIIRVCRTVLVVVAFSEFQMQIYLFKIPFDQLRSYEKLVFGRKHLKFSFWSFLEQLGILEVLGVIKRYFGSWMNFFNRGYTRLMWSFQRTTPFHTPSEVLWKQRFWICTPWWGGGGEGRGGSEFKFLISEDDPLLNSDNSWQLSVWW